MKYIFDFDDVLFHTSKQGKNYLFKNLWFSALEKAGIPMNLILEYYEKERLNQISLKKALRHFSLDESLYEEIMSQSKNFVNAEIIEVIKKIGKSNCIILTYGDIEFQLDKIKRSGIEHLFSQIISVPGSKKETIEELCSQYKDEQVIFIDDSIKHFKDLNFKKYPNLKTILFDEKGLEKLKAEIKN